MSNSPNTSDISLEKISDAKIDIPKCGNKPDCEKGKNLGVAFSGGGIRSAAFCSGVLRRLIRKEKEPDYLSCVSGGGYTGSAYVQWKYHKRGKEKKNWTDEFFNQMRDNTGYFCNWQKNVCCGCIDSIILGALIVFVAFIVPLIGWGSFACPIAFLVNLLYGKFLDGTLCREDDDSVDCQERTILFAVSILIFIGFHVLEYLSDCCENNENFSKMTLPKVLLKLGQLISGATFALTFFPWFINNFLQFTHLSIRVGIIVLTASFWFFIPLLRKYSSLVGLIYAYSYVVYWHVYKGKLFHIEYTEKRFQNGMIVSLVLLAVFSVLGEFPRRLFHVYNRWRLQKAFYNQEWKEQCCYCYDIFPGGHCPPCCCPSCSCPPTDTSNIQNQTKITTGALTLAHLHDTKPQYISNVVVNGWRRNYEKKYCPVAMDPKGSSVINEQPESTTVQIENDKVDNQNQTDSTTRASTLAHLHDTKPQYTSNVVVNGWRRNYEKKYCPVAMHPKGISVIDKQPPSTTVELANDVEFQDKLKASDIKLSSAMAISAAAASPYLGKHEEHENRFTHILTICGMDMAASVVYDMKGERNEEWYGPPCLYCANFIIMVLISVGGVFLVLKKMTSISSLPVLTTTLVVGVILAVLAVAVLIYRLVLCCCSNCNADTCQCHPKVSSLHRWCEVHLPIYRFVCSMLNIINHSSTPPAKLHLSDGGHFETYGLLPLLKLRLPKILVVDGSKIESDEDYAKDIIEAMEHARKLFDCSFTPKTGNGDVLTDIKNKYVKEDSSRTYEFKVHYATGDTGDIVLIAPRSPEDATGEDHPTWENERCEGRKKPPLDKVWGTGPYLTKNDVSDINGCFGCLGCCDCCAEKCCQCGNCSPFPRHSTLNQFFTPRMFAAYHREGYRACMECDDFLV